MLFFSSTTAVSYPKGLLCVSIVSNTLKLVKLLTCNCACFRDGTVTTCATIRLPTTHVYPCYSAFKVYS